MFVCSCLCTCIRPRIRPCIRTCTCIFCCSQCMGTRMTTHWHVHLHVCEAARIRLQKRTGACIRSCIRRYLRILLVTASIASARSQQQAASSKRQAARAAPAHPHTGSTQRRARVQLLTQAPPHTYPILTDLMVLAHAHTHTHTHTPTRACSFAAFLPCMYRCMHIMHPCLNWHVRMRMRIRVRVNARFQVCRCVHQA
jgi:hypothetical protein